MIGQDLFIKRREALASKMGRGIGLFVGNVETPKDYLANTYEFSQDSTFRYFFGIDRPGLIGVIDFEKNLTYISGTDYTQKDFVLMGKQPSILEEAQQFGVTNFIPAAEFNLWFDNFSENRELFFIKPHRAENLLTLSEITGRSLNDIKKHYSEEFLRAIIGLRGSKSKEEVAEIERAVNVIRMMHLKAMEVIKPWMREYEVVAAVNAVAMNFNCSISFQTICTKNPAVLYSHKYEGVLKEGDLLLLDCGVKTSSGYCGDMTSTIPVSGKFSERQKEIYDILMEMFDGAVAELAPGKSFKVAHDRACRILIEKFLELGFFRGDAEEIFQSGTHSLFFIHGLGHKIGMDVYDMENYCKFLVGFKDRESKDERFGFKIMRLGRELEPGFTFTVEPGIYFIPELIEQWKKNGINSQYLNYDKIEKYLDFGGMRFERNFVMGETAPRQLGKTLPKTAHEIEKTMWELKACRDYIR